MSSLIYNSALYDEAVGAIDFDSDTFKVMLVTSSYSPDKAIDTKRSDVTNEVPNGNGYTTGGTLAIVSVTNDTVNNRIDVALGAVNWTAATISARGAVYYKSRGGPSSDDELVAYIDFGGDVSSTAGTFSLTASTLRIQN